MIKDKVYDYFMNQDKNCAEAVFLAANDTYGLNASEEAIKAIGVFGGGIGCGSLCGATAGAVTAIGIKYSTGHAHASNEMIEKSKSYMAEFTEAFTSDLCEVIKPIYRKDDVRCLDVVVKAVEILEKYM